MRDVERLAFMETLIAKQEKLQSATSKLLVFRVLEKYSQIIKYRKFRKKYLEQMKK